MLNIIMLRYNFLFYLFGLVPSVLLYGEHMSTWRVNINDKIKPRREKMVLRTSRRISVSVRMSGHLAKPQIYFWLKFPTAYVSDSIDSGETVRITFPEPLLLAYAITALFPWRGSLVYYQLTANDTYINVTRQRTGDMIRQITNIPFQVYNYLHKCAAEENAPWQYSNFA